MKFIETSAKSAENVENAFNTMTKEIINIKKKSKVQEDNTKKNIVIGKGKSENLNNGKKGCCK